MKRTVSTVILFAIIVTSSTAVFGQKGRISGLRSISDFKVQANVVIAKPEAFTDGNGVYIRWRTEYEKDNLGFYVHRLDGDSKVIVDNRFITGSLTKYRDEAVSGEEYSIFDVNGGGSSRYVIESFDRSGNSIRTDPILPEFISDLTSIAGESSDILRGNRSKATGNIETAAPQYSKEIASQMDRSVQLADPITQRWVAAQPGVKIGVRQTGMYRVTKAQLQTAGLDVSDPSLWQVYTDGVQQAVLVGPNGDYLDFYGKSLDTVESDTRMYYVVVGQDAGRRMLQSRLRPSFSTVRASNYDETVRLKERTSYISRLFNGDEENFVGGLVTSNPRSVNVNVSGVDNLTATVFVSVRFLGYSATAHMVDLTLNGQSIGQATGNGSGQFFTYTVAVDSSLLQNGINSLGMVAPTSQDFSFFDQVQINYKRRHVAFQNAISFPMQNYRGAKLEGFTSPNIRLFDITLDGQVIQMTGGTALSSGATFDLMLPAYRARAMFAVDDSALLSPTSITPNTPSTLATVNHNANLVIISHKNFLTQANAWKEYRAGQGTLVEVLDVEDVFDEFNFGVLSANSIEDFLNYAKTNWQTPPQYVLLIGEGSYDSRNYEGRGFWNLIPVKMVDTVYLETVSDEALADFNNDGLAELAIGRIPARSPEEVTNALNKTMSFEALVATQNLSRGIIFHYDNPIGYDFFAMSGRMRDQLPVAAPSVLVARADTSPNMTLVSELNNGRYLFNFAGHGTTGIWASSANFQLGNVALLSNNNNLTVFTMLTCLNGYFIGSNISMAEMLLNSTTGGAAAAWASSGETTPDVQEIMGQRFYHQVGVGIINRLGDLIVDAKSVVPGGRDVRLSWVLIGDPMLKMR